MEVKIEAVEFDRHGFCTRATARLTNRTLITDRLTVVPLPGKLVFEFFVSFDLSAALGSAPRLASSM